MENQLTNETKVVSTSSSYKNKYTQQEATTTMTTDHDDKEGALRRGDAVSIIRGSYARYKEGVFLGPYGTKMARVQVNGDCQHERNLRLTSIIKKKIKKKKTRTNTRESSKEESSKEETKFCSKQQHGVHDDRLAEVALELKKMNEAIEASMEKQSSFEAQATCILAKMAELITLVKKINE